METASGGDISVDIGKDEGERLSKLREAHEARDGFRIVIVVYYIRRACRGKWGSKEQMGKGWTMEAFCIVHMWWL